MHPGALGRNSKARRSGVMTPRHWMHWSQNGTAKKGATKENQTMSPKLFKRINEFLARLIYTPSTPEAMRQAAKDARQSLHRLYGTNKCKRLQIVQTLQTKPSTLIEAG